MKYRDLSLDTCCTPTPCNARVLFPRPPRSRKAAASLFTDPETEDHQAERLSQGHSVNPKPGRPPLPTESHRAVPAPGGACAVTREPVLRPAAWSSRGRGDGAEGLARDSARRDPPSCPPRTHPPLPARKASASKARAHTARRSRRLREPRIVPGSVAARKYSSRK